MTRLPSMVITVLTPRHVSEFVLNGKASRLQVRRIIDGASTTR